MSAATSQPSRLDLPGFNLPLNFTPAGNDLFLTVLNGIDSYGDGGFVPLRLIPKRELTMLQIMDALTDIEGWEGHIFNDKIVQEYKTEAIAYEGVDITQRMVDWVIEELRFKATISKSPDPVVVYTGGIIKSDRAVSHTIQTSIRQAARELGNIHMAQRDSRPDSKGQILDLTDPSLYPLVYGRTRVLPDYTIGLDDCIANCGKGDIIPLRSTDETVLPGQHQDDGSYYSRRRKFPPAPYSRRFQWLPADVTIGDGGKARFTSYINNLHPRLHGTLYSIIEEVITAAIPLWNKTLTGLQVNTHARHQYERIIYHSVRYISTQNLIPQGQLGENSEAAQRDYLTWELDEFERQHVLPEPGDFRLPSPPRNDMIVDLQKQHGDQGLQIIVKMTNLELTPQELEYGGEMWQVDGQLNEHICATALYYYDVENIHDSRLAFRQQCDTETANTDISCPQEDNSFLSAVFGIKDNIAVQEIGSVACKSGRLLTYSNILQTQVKPFKLADASKPGHVKILALFLVDPGIRIISTANVPPQQKQWVLHDTKGTMDVEEAKEVRMQLMEERQEYNTQLNMAFLSTQFSLV